MTFNKRQFLTSSVSILLLLGLASHIMQTSLQPKSSYKRLRKLQDKPLIAEPPEEVPHEEIPYEETIPYEEIVHEDSSHEEHNEEEYMSTYPPSHPKFWMCLLVAFLLIMMAAICSGMTVGYLSIDELQLEIKKSQGTPDEQRQAKIIHPLLQQHHMLLCTLLVANAFAMEALPIFFDKIVPPAFAVLISVFFIVFCGEIIPQAVCTGPNQLSIAERVTPLIKLIMFVFFPIIWPLAKALDLYFGEHDAPRFEKNELKALIELHEKKNDEKRGFAEAEINMITSTIDLKTKSVMQAMIPLKQIVMIKSSLHLSGEVLQKISNSGYSYIGVYEGEKENIVGQIKTKQLIEVAHDRSKGRKLTSLNIIKPPLIVSSDTNLLEMLMIFKQKKTKIAFIEEKTQQDAKAVQAAMFRSISQQIVEGQRVHKVVGLISMKDVFEELVKKELEDQDQHVHYYSVNQTQKNPNKFQFEEEEEEEEK